MATFYVLPSRHLLGQSFSETLTSLFSETRHTPWDWPDLAESLAAVIEAPGDAYVVYREDLDERISVKDALVRQFGAAMDDDVVEVHLGAGLPQVVSQRRSAEIVQSAA